MYLIYLSKREEATADLNEVGAHNAIIAELTVVLGAPFTPKMRGKPLNL